MGAISAVTGVALVALAATAAWNFAHNLSQVTDTPQEPASTSITSLAAPQEPASTSTTSLASSQNFSPQEGKKAAFSGATSGDASALTPPRPAVLSFTLRGTFGLSVISEGSQISGPALPGTSFAAACLKIVQNDTSFQNKNIDWSQWTIIAADNPLPKSTMESAWYKGQAALRKLPPAGQLPRDERIVILTKQIFPELGRMGKEIQENAVLQVEGKPSSTKKSWRASMNPTLAENFASDSHMPGIFYHGSILKKATILEEGGLKPQGSSNVFGVEIYLFPEKCKESAENYTNERSQSIYANFGGLAPTGEVLQTRVYCTCVGVINQLTQWEKWREQHIIDPVKQYAKDNILEPKAYSADGSRDIQPRDIVNYVTDSIFKQLQLDVLYVENGAQQVTSGDAFLCVLEKERVTIIN